MDLCVHHHQWISVCVWYCAQKLCKMFANLHIMGCLLELGDIPQKNRKEGIFVIPVSISSKNFIPANRHTVRIPVWTSTHTYALIHFYFHSVQCIWNIVRVKDSFNFYSYLILGTVLYT